MPNSEIKYVKGAEPDKRSYKVKFGKIKTKITKFNPKWNVQLGAKQLFEAYKEVDLRVEDFEGSKFRRILNLENSVRNGILDKNLFRMK